MNCHYPALFLYKYQVYLHCFPRILFLRVTFRSMEPAITTATPYKTPNKGANTNTMTGVDNTGLNKVSVRAILVIKNR